MSSEMAIQLSIGLPLLGALLVWICDKRPNLREAMTLLIAAATFGAVLTLVGTVWEGGRPGVEWLEVMPAALDGSRPALMLAFEVEPLGMLFALVASGLWILTSFYTIGYMRAHHEKDQTRFFACFALAIFAALGIAFSRNLLTLFVFYEILTFTTYPLVTHARTDNAMRSGRIYLGILVGTSVCFLLTAILWTWVATGTTEFTVGGILAGNVTDSALPWLLALFMFGTGKAALMPFHRWLPAAMVAPTPVSALLHAVAVVKAGVFTVVKIIVYIFGLDLLTTTSASQWLMVVAAATILLSSFVAMTKDNLKARLAYSTISQLAYIVLGAAMASEMGLTGSGMHIATHAVGKITLFFCAGAIYVTAHKTDISTMNGLGRKMPFTMAAFFIASLSIIGLPPFAGVWSKWFLGCGALQSDQLWLVVVLMLSSILNVAYLLPIPIKAFFAEPDPEPEHGTDDAHGGHDTHGEGIQEAPAFCLVPLCLTALGCVVLFFCAGPLEKLVRMAVAG